MICNFFRFKDDNILNSQLCVQQGQQSEFLCWLMSLYWKTISRTNKGMSRDPLTAVNTAETPGKGLNNKWKHKKCMIYINIHTNIVKDNAI